MMSLLKFITILYNHLIFSSIFLSRQFYSFCRTPLIKRRYSFKFCLSFFILYLSKAYIYSWSTFNTASPIILYYHKFVTCLITIQFSWSYSTQSVYYLLCYLVFHVTSHLQILTFLLNFHIPQVNRFCQSSFLNVVSCSIYNCSLWSFRVICCNSKLSAIRSGFVPFSELTSCRVGQVYSSLLELIFFGHCCLVDIGKLWSICSRFQDLLFHIFPILLIFPRIQSTYKISSVLRKLIAYWTTFSNSFQNILELAIKLKKLIYIYFDECNMMQYFPRLIPEFNQYTRTLQKQKQLFEILSVAYNSNLR